jgi:hypothetical protein
MRWPSGIAVACAALTVAPAATAAQPVVAAPIGPATVETSIPLRITGALSVQFRGDPAAGCARWGLCGYSGDVLWQPPQSGSITISRTAGRHPRVTVTLIPSDPLGTGITGGMTTANVTLAGTGAASPAAHCVDATATDDGPTLSLHHGQITMSLANRAQPLLATRCAGPHDADVLSHIPVRTLTLAALERGRTPISLAAVGALRAHGLSGFITSTVVLHVGAPGRPRTERDTGSEGPTEPGREIDVNYRATLSGSVVEQVRGAANSLQCAPLGSCGVAGTITLTPRVHTTFARLFATARATTPHRELLAAAGLAPGGTGQTSGVGIVAWRGGGSVRSDLAQGASRCIDSAPFGVGQLLIVTSGRRWRVSLPAGGVLGLGTPATRCPGPILTAGLLAGANAPLSTFDRRTAQIALMRGSTVQDDGYRVRIVPHLTLTLTRVRVRSKALRLGAGDLGS